MQAKLQVKVLDLSYNLELKSNLILVMGNSGTGKTVLFNGLSDIAYFEQYTQSFTQYVLVNYKNYKMGIIDSVLQDKGSPKFVVIANASVILNYKQRLMISMDMKNQYLIFTHNLQGFKVGPVNIAEMGYDTKKQEFNLQYKNI